MAYRDRDKGSGRSNRDRDRDRRRGQFRNEESRSAAAEGTTPETPVVVLKRRPTAEGTPSSTSAPTTPRVTESKPPVILLRPSKARETDNNASPSASTPLPEMNSRIEQKMKEKQGPSLMELLRPYKYNQELAIPLVDNHMKLVMENQFDFITGQKKNSDFLVVSAIGPPHSGKSSILSYLAEKTKFGDGKVFKYRSRSEQKECSIYMASNNIIFIEMASVFNGAAAADLINSIGLYGNLETAITAWNLRLMRWALSVSHVVLLVTESLIDPNLLQLVNSAEMIAPMDSSFGETSYPELIFVCNKVKLPGPEYSKLQAQLECIFKSVIGRPPRLKRNVFLLPHNKFVADSNDDRYDEFKKSVTDLNTYFRAPFAEKRELVSQKISLHEWFQSLNRFWDDMNQPNYFTNYVKLFP